MAPLTSPTTAAQYANNRRKIEAWLQFLATRWQPLDVDRAAGVTLEVMFTNVLTSLWTPAKGTLHFPMSYWASMRRIPLQSGGIFCQSNFLIDSESLEVVTVACWFVCKAVISTHVPSECGCEQLFCLYNLLKHAVMWRGWTKHGQRFLWRSVGWTL